MDDDTADIRKEADRVINNLLDTLEKDNPHIRLGRRSYDRTSRTTSTRPKKKD